MTKITQIILLYLININNINGQSFEKLIEILKTCKTVNEFKNKAPNYKESIIENKLDTIFNTWITRDIGFAYKQYRDYFSASDPKGESHNFLITCILYKDSIILGHIEEYRDYILPIRIMPKKVFCIDNQYLNKYIEQRKTIFRRRIKIKDLIADLRQDLTIELGCGEAGKSYSKEYKKMKRYIECKNKPKLNNWLRSANCELQVYGAIGILQLNKKGLILTGEEKEIISFLTQQNSKITYCGGCLYGLSGTFIEMIRD